MVGRSQLATLQKILAFIWRWNSVMGSEAWTRNAV